MKKRILYPTDCSAADRHVQARVVELARAFGAKVIVFHAIEPFSSEPGDRSFDDLYAALQKKARTGVSAIARELRTAGIRCATMVTVARRWSAIVELARTAEVEMIVMGTHEQEAGGARVPGSTSHRVFAAAPCPLFIVPVRAVETTSRAAPPRIARPRASVRQSATRSKRRIQHAYEFTTE